MTEVLAVIAAFALFIGGILGTVDIYGRYQCNNYKEVTGKNAKWKTLDVCYIETADGWQRWDEYTKRAIASEGLKK